MQNAVREKEERLEMREKLSTFGAVGTNEDILFLSELAEFYKEKGDWELQAEVERAIINIARRAGNKEALKKLLDYDEAKNALVELSTPDDLPLIDDMLKSQNPSSRVAALRMLKKIGSRGDLPRIIKRLKSDQDNKVKEAAAEAFAQFAWREDLPMIRDMGKSEDMYSRQAAGSAFSRIASREDLDELKKYCENYKSRDYFKAGLVKIATRADVNFKALGEYMKQEGGWRTSLDDVAQIFLEAFPRLATPEDMDFIQALLKSNTRNLKLAGFRAYCKLLTEFDVSELLRYLVDYGAVRGERDEVTETNQEVAAIAAETYGRLATEDDLPEIKTMLNGRVREQRRAAAWALSKPNVAQQIPQGLKELLKEIAGKREEVGDVLAQSLLSMLTTGWTMGLPRT